MIKELEITENVMQELLASTGATDLVSSNFRFGRKGGPIFEFEAGGKKVAINDGNGMKALQDGDVYIFIERLASILRVNNEDVSAPGLLKGRAFRSALLENIDTGDLRPNIFLSTISRLFEDEIPVFYGSTAGINIAEILETSIASDTLSERGIRSSVIFDFDGKKGQKSQEIFVGSRRLLRNDLQDIADILVEEKQNSLIDARLEATRDILQEIDSLPKITLIDGERIIEKMIGEFNFTLGQLLLMAKIAGQKPQLFKETLNGGFGEVTITPDNLLQKAQNQDPMSAISESIIEFLGNSRKMGGFTYYARDARMGQFDGAFAVPFKLTNKANIYKILEPLNSLFRENRGTILLPVTRQRIQSRNFSEPIDPIVLSILLENSPKGFKKLIRDFRSRCKVLNEKEVQEVGTRDSVFFIEDYFKKELKNG